MRMVLKKMLLERIVKQSTGCWHLRTTPNRHGYSRIKFNGKKIAGHRASYISFVGKIKSGAMICHRCDNKRCVNPEHLYAGDASSNMKDAYERGRLKPPFLMGGCNRKIKDDVVIKIHKERDDINTSYQNLGDKYGLSKSHARWLCLPQQRDRFISGDL